MIRRLCLLSSLRLAGYSERLEKVIEKNLRPVSGKVMDKTSFRSRVTGKLVQTFLFKKRRSLRDLFEKREMGNAHFCLRDFNLGVPNRVIATHMRPEQTRER